MFKLKIACGIALLGLISCKSTNISNNQSDGWQYSYDKDSMTDHVREVAYMVKQGMNLANELAYVKLEVGCGGKGKFVAFSYSLKTIEALYRIDNKKPVDVEEFLNFDDVHTSIVSGEPAKNIIDGLLNGEKLLLRRQSYSALSKSDHEFNIGINTDVVRKALVRCM